MMEKNIYCLKLILIYYIVKILYGLKRLRILSNVELLF
jgi:hypothetical protein